MQSFLELVNLTTSDNLCFDSLIDCVTVKLVFNQKGFAHLFILIVFLIVIVVAAGFYFAVNKNQSVQPQPVQQSGDKPVLNPFTDSSAEVIKCIKDTIGEKNYEEITKNQPRRPTQEEIKATDKCTRKFSQGNALTPPPDQKDNPFYNTAEDPNFYEANPEPEKTYSKKVINDKPLILSGNQVMEITDTYYVQKNNINLSGNAKLIIKNSYFKQLLEYFSQYKLDLYDNAELIIEDSDVRGTNWFFVAWDFFDNSKISYKNVTTNIPFEIWTSAHDNSQVTADNSAFGVTVGQNAKVTITNSPRAGVELIIKGAQTQATLKPGQLTSYTFPEKPTSGIDFQITLKDSYVASWGVSLQEGAKVTLVNSKLGNVGMAFGPEKEIVELTDYTNKVYSEKKMVYKDIELVLKNSSAKTWTMTPFGDVTLKLNKVIAESFTMYPNFAKNAEFIGEDMDVAFISTTDNTKVTLTNSRVWGDIVAKDNSVVTLINTEAKGGKKATEGNGKIIEK